MATLKDTLKKLGQAFGADIKSLKDSTGKLDTLAQDFKDSGTAGSLVSAINFVLGKAQAASSTGGAQIADDAKSADKTYSSNKIEELVSKATEISETDSTEILKAYTDARDGVSP
jgi:hypothetical protein|nr:MAG TPA: hypothetical protein [Caudoviricetes sp.]